MSNGSVIEFPRDFSNFPFRTFLIVVAVLVGAVAVVSSVYTVEPDEVGVVMRFGRFTKTTPPGLHFRLPLIDSVRKVKAQRQLKEEFGFRTASTRESREDRPEDESRMLSGDLNAASVEWSVQYRIVEPEKYLFRVRNVVATLRDMSEAVMRQVVGDRTVNEVLTVGRTEIAALVEQELQRLCDEYQNGIVIDQVLLQQVDPPEAVKDSFNEVNRSQQEKETLINGAQSEYNRVIPRARGEALKTIEAAEGYALDRVNRARGDAARFDSLYGAYRASPEVTRRRIYLETLERVLPEIGRKIVVDDDLEGLLPLLEIGPLSRLGEDGG